MEFVVPSEAEMSDTYSVLAASGDLEEQFLWSSVTRSHDERRKCRNTARMAAWWVSIFVACVESSRVKKLFTLMVFLCVQEARSERL
jgi:hypothetical protein